MKFKTFVVLGLLCVFAGCVHGSLYGKRLEHQLKKLILFIQNANIKYVRKNSLKRNAFNKSMQTG